MRKLWILLFFVVIIITFIACDLSLTLVKKGALIEKYKMLNPWQGASSVTINYLGKLWVREMGTEGTISCAGLNTGSGAMTFNQGVKTTDSPTFAGLNLGNSSKSTNGYTRLPNGLLLQWGTGTGTVTFPIAFTTVYQVVATNITSLTTQNQKFPIIASVSNTRFMYFTPSAGADPTTTNLSCSYIAIGV